MSLLFTQPLVSFFFPHLRRVHTRYCFPKNCDSLRIRFVIGREDAEAKKPPVVYFTIQFGRSPEITYTLSYKEEETGKQMWLKIRFTTVQTGERWCGEKTASSQTYEKKIIFTSFSKYKIADIYIKTYVAKSHGHSL